MVLLGTQFYNGNEDANRRQANSAASMIALAGVELANVQWRDESVECDGFETLRVLERDQRDVAHAPAPRKPVIADIFGALATEATRRGHRYFAFVNNDITVLPAAIDAIERGGKETYAISRMDFHRDTGRDADIVISGLDLFAMDVDWWARHRGRFRPYVLGEWFYDCVFAAILMTYGDGIILNRRGEIRHEIHKTNPQMTGPSARFNGYLAALDSRLFSLWVDYYKRILDARARRASEAEELAFIKSEFVWRPSAVQAAKHAARCVRSRWRYSRTIGQP
jgi:hypothetical protein